MHVLTYYTCAYITCTHLLHACRCGKLPPPVLMFANVDFHYESRPENIIYTVSPPPPYIIYTVSTFTVVNLQRVLLV